MLKSCNCWYLAVLDGLVAALPIEHHNGSAMSISPGEQPAPSAPPADVDAICDVFEAAWYAGQAPRIEDFLPRGDLPQQDVLLRELLLAEWDLRRRRGQDLKLETYASRFPNSRQ